jgi:hypothetical protein
MSLSSHSQSLGLEQDSDFTLKKHQEKFEGFDFLRAIFALAILADHARLFLLLKLWRLDSLSDILYANFSSLAVPCFLQMSLFIFILKSEKRGWFYFLNNRFLKLVSLYLFWVTSKILFDILLDSTKANEFAHLSLRRTIEVLVSGGNSPFYFFFSLLFVTILAAVLISLFKKLENPSTRLKLIYSLLIASSGFIFFTSIMSFTVGSNPDANSVKIAHTILNISHWAYNPLNFIPYIFTALITAHEFSHRKIKKTCAQKLKLCGMFALFLASTLIDWFLFKNKGDILHYARISLIFGSWLFLYLALLSTCKPPRLIQFLSECSLGIYAFHLFFTHALFSSSFYSLNGLAKVMPGLDIVIEFFLTLAGSVALTVLFKKTPGLRKLV